MSFNFSAETERIFESKNEHERRRSHGCSQTLTDAHICRALRRSRSLHKKTYKLPEKRFATRCMGTKTSPLPGVSVDFQEIHH